MSCRCSGFTESLHWAVKKTYKKRKAAVRFRVKSLTTPPLVPASSRQNIAEPARLRYPPQRIFSGEREDFVVAHNGETKQEVRASGEILHLENEVTSAGLRMMRTPVLNTVPQSMEWWTTKYELPYRKVGNSGPQSRRQWTTKYELVDHKVGIRIKRRCFAAFLTECSLPLFYIWGLSLFIVKRKLEKHLDLLDFGSGNVGVGVGDRVVV